MKFGTKRNHHINFHSWNKVKRKIRTHENSQNVI